MPPGESTHPWTSATIPPRSIPALPDERAGALRGDEVAARGGLGEIA
jgi:hypothetical protein